MDYDVQGLVGPAAISATVAYFVMKLAPMEALWVAGITLVSNVIWHWVKAYLGEMMILGNGPSM